MASWLRHYVCLLATFLLLNAGAVAAQGSGETTLVVVRHAEKPAAGLGLLTCRGLNRAALLPDYFRQNFPKPDFIFAPDPSVKATEIHGDGKRHDYVRPLLTIGPTAVYFQVPIDTQIPFNDPGLLADTLLAKPYLGSTVYVAWEHMNIDLLAKILLRRFDSDTKVPEWPNSDYDTVFVFRIRGEPGNGSIVLDVDQQEFGKIEERCQVVAP